VSCPNLGDVLGLNRSRKSFYSRLRQGGTAFLLGVVIQLLIAGEAPALKLSGATPAGFMALAKDIQVDNLAPKKNVALRVYDQLNLLASNGEFDGVVVDGVAPANCETLLDFSLTGEGQGGPAGIFRPELRIGMQFFNNSGRSPVVFETKLNLGVATQVAARPEHKWPDVVFNINSEEYVCALGFWNVLGGGLGCVGGLSGGIGRPFGVAQAIAEELQLPNEQPRLQDSNNKKQKREPSKPSRIVRDPLRFEGDLFVDFAFSLRSRSAFSVCSSAS
jgi:hypothetical protein